jgi:ATP-binding cassette subfamily B protein
VKDRVRITMRLLSYLSPYKLRVVGAYGAMGVVTLLNMVMPALLGWVVDIGLTPLAERTAEMVEIPDWIPLDATVEAFALSADRSFLIAAAAALVAVAIVRAFFAFWLIYLASWLGQVTSYDIRNQYFRHVQHLSFGFHDRSQTGDLMSRAIGDILKVRMFLGEGLIEALNIPVLFFFVAVVLFRMDPHLAVIGLSPLVVLAVVTLRFGQVIEPRFKLVQDQEGVISARAQENFSGMRVVKTFAREPWETERFQEANETFLQRRIRVIASFADYFPTMNAIVAFAMVLVLWFGGRGVLAGDVTLGTLVSFSFYIVLLASPTQNLGFLVNRAGEAVAAGRRLFEILDTKSDIVERPDAIELPTIRGEVAFDHVTFNYGDRDVLHDVTFQVEPNMIVALFGPTGSGKSTVVNLIPRFYDVRDGAVLIDGHDVRDVTIDSLRRQIATVHQDTFLFSATIRDNIAYGRLDADEDAVIAAAKAARAHEFILELPDGYDTLIGERGVNLSGGQRQRIAIARALLMEPRILVLDDATSAVDTETEHQIQEALAELMAGRTTFIIAQRLLTLKRADLILVMDGGRIVERGTHEELVAEGGLYARIYDLQLRDQERMAQAAGAVGTAGQTATGGASSPEAGGGAPSRAHGSSDEAGGGSTT